MVNAERNVNKRQVCLKWKNRQLIRLVFATGQLVIVIRKKKNWPTFQTVWSFKRLSKPRYLVKVFVYGAALSARSCWPKPASPRWSGCCCVLLSLFFLDGRVWLSGGARLSCGRRTTKGSCSHRELGNSRPDIGEVQTRGNDGRVRACSRLGTIMPLSFRAAAILFDRCFLSVLLIILLRQFFNGCPNY